MPVTRKTVTVSELAIEVTRRCNMACEHCLRGDAQNLDFDVKYLDQLLDQGVEVRTVTFSGGEPSLVVDIIKKCFDCFERHGTALSGFFVATNGREPENQKALAVLLLEKYPDMEEPETCGVSISRDQYHDSEPWPKGSDIVRGLKFYTASKEKDDYDEENLIPQGRALENGIANDRRMKYEPSTFSLDCEWDDSVCIDYLYLSANGYVYPSCNLSYETMDAKKLCPVTEITDVLNNTEDGKVPGMRFF